MISGTALVLVIRGAGTILASDTTFLPFGGLPLLFLCTMFVPGLEEVDDLELVSPSLLPASMAGLPPTSFSKENRNYPISKLLPSL